MKDTKNKNIHLHDYNWFPIFRRQKLKHIRWAIENINKLRSNSIDYIDSSKCIYTYWWRILCLKHNAVTTLQTTHATMAAHMTPTSSPWESSIVVFSSVAGKYDTYHRQHVWMSLVITEDYLKLFSQSLIVFRQCISNKQTLKLFNVFFLFSLYHTFSISRTRTSFIFESD